MEELFVEKILVAVDFSDHSNVALEQALHVASQRPGSKLVLLWVEDEHPHRESGEIELHSTSTQDLHPAFEDPQQSARVKLEILADRAKSHGLAVDVQIRHGYADEVIVEVGREVGASLIIVGTRGLTGFKRFLLGSVAEKVVRMSSTNVLVARGEARAFSHVLVATDFSAASEHALQLALALSKPDAQIDVLHAWQYPPGMRGTPDPKQEGLLSDIGRDVVRRVQKLGDALTQRYAATSRTLEFTNVFGPAAAVIHERLESNMYDLVAMGTHGHRGFRRFLLGSVAEATVRHAPCSVLVTHGPSEA